VPARDRPELRPRYRIARVALVARCQGGYRVPLELGRRDHQSRDLAGLPLVVRVTGVHSQSLESPSGVLRGRQERDRGNELARDGRRYAARTARRGGRSSAHAAWRAAIVIATVSTAITLGAGSPMTASTTATICRSGRDVRRPAVSNPFSAADAR